jgi:two-component system, response regulator PdtaR
MNTASTAPNSLPALPANAPSLGRILVVDDDRLVLATVTHGLSQAGYEVIDADNGDDAILLAREHRPQLALLDIRMEGMSGFEVAQTLRDAYAIPFMFLSAFADEATLAKVHELGAMAYLVKPLDVGQIVPSVEAVFARLRSSAAAQVSAGVPPSQVALPVASPASASQVGEFSDPVPLAVGVLMHRHSLPRAQAFARLQRLAHENQRSVAAQAERLLSAIEELAGTAI